MRIPLVFSKIPGSWENPYLCPLFLAAFAVLLFFPGLGLRDFWAPVEPRYAEIARVMLAKGEWIVPTVNGELYTDKPILYFWLVLLGSKLVGSVNEWSVRLPSAVSAFGLVFTTYLLGRDLFNARVGLFAALVFATSARVLWEARWAHTDMTFTFFFTLSIYFLSKAIFQKRDRPWFLLACGMMGLATLTKGLIGFVLPGLVMLAFVALRWDWRAVLEWHLLPGIAIFLLVAAPWFVAVSLATGGEWIKDFIWVHHIQGYTAGAGHREPFSYYFLNFPLDFLPWTVFAVPAIFAYKSRRLFREPLLLFLFLWFIVIFLFFSLSDTKRGLYLLPIIPAAALFVACYFDDLIERRIPQGLLYRWLGFLFFTLLWVSSLSVPLVAGFLEKEAAWNSLPFALVMAVGGFITAGGIRRQLPSRVFFSTVCTTLGGMLCLSVWVLPWLDLYKSPRFFSLQVKNLIAPSEPLYIYADSMNDFNFYAEREVIPILSSKADIEQALSEGSPIYLVIRERDSKTVIGTQESEILAERQVGGKKWSLIRLSKDEAHKREQPAPQQLTLRDKVARVTSHAHRDY
jgi:4-amino-4-deoxy-L-arabinose transferase-like glycosyltransferase